ncbi:hypothetical protein QOZ80_2AG0131920 [Eleusine coracana subsp. coracana]|nr:hypothetical protein QOZ80_2AG0131920 [Eleusine coracana subsp. coracana]
MASDFPRQRWLFPVWYESPRRQWAFVRKAYGIVALQLVFAGGVAVFPCFVTAVSRFFTSAPHLVPYSVLATVVVAPFIALWPMIVYREKRPANLLLLCLMTVLISFSIAVLISVFVPYLGVVLLQSFILTEAGVITLILCTFWSAMRNDQPDSYALPIVATILVIMVVHFTIQATYPLGNVYLTSWACLSSYLFTSFMLHQPVRITDHKEYEYVLAAISMYAYLIKLRCLKWMLV